MILLSHMGKFYVLKELKMKSLDGHNKAISEKFQATRQGVWYCVQSKHFAGDRPPVACSKSPRMSCHTENTVDFMLLVSIRDYSSTKCHKNLMKHLCTVMYKHSCTTVML